MKRCFRCGKVKTLDGFYKYGQMKDGHLNKCIECTKEDVKKNREKRAEYYKAFDRARANLPRRVEARKAYSLTPRGKEVSFKASTKFRQNNPEKYEAHMAVAVAVSSGRLVKPDVCQECRAFLSVQAHHEDYTKPLEVVWLCSKCHAKRHRPDSIQYDAAV